MFNQDLSLFQKKKVSHFLQDIRVYHIFFISRLE